MVSAVTVGLNSFATMDEANAYLADQLRAADNWDATDPDAQKRAMITSFRLLEKQKWKGTATGVRVVASAAVAAGGSGYVVDEILTVSGGTAGQPARARVATISGGAVATIEMLDVGTYTVEPSSPAATTASASGTGCTLTLTFQDQTAKHPRTGLVDLDGTAVDDDTYAQLLKYAQIELAYELTVDADLETAGGIGSNVQSVDAGEVSVEFFRSTGGVGGTGSLRFPITVWELLRSFLASNATGTLGGVATGTETEAVLTDYPSDYGLTEGL